MFNAYAADCGDYSNGSLGIKNPVLPFNIGCSYVAEGDTIAGNIIGAVVGIFLVVGSIAALLYLMIGAFVWITSAGDKNRLQEARERIIHALLGLIILASVWALMILIGEFTGLGFPTFILPTVL